VDIVICTKTTMAYTYVLYILIRPSSYLITCNNFQLYRSAIKVLDPIAIVTRCASW